MHGDESQSFLDSGFRADFFVKVKAHRLRLVNDARSKLCHEHITNRAVWAGLGILAAGRIHNLITVNDVMFSGTLPPNRAPVSFRLFVTQTLQPRQGDTM